MEPLDPDRLRVSDRDRDRVAEVLREAAGEGRIDLTELDERLESTYAAKTYAELAPLTRDLPTPQHPVVPRMARTPVEPRPTGLEPSYVRVEGFGIMGSYSESRPKVPSEVTADSPLVRLQGVAVWGNVEVTRRRMPTP